MRIRLALRLATLLPMLSSVASAQTPGNVWHLPRNLEPAGVAGMRNPPYGILTNTAVTLYNGSFAPEGDQSAGLVWYRPPGGAWASVAMSFASQNGNNKYWRAMLPATFRRGEAVEYYFEISFTDRATTYVYGTDTT